MGRKISRTCQNCDAPIAHAKAVYCGTLCARAASLTRQARRGIAAGDYFGSTAAEIIAGRRNRLAAEDRLFTEERGGGAVTVLRAPTLQERLDWIIGFDRRVLATKPLRICDSPNWRWTWRGHR